MDSICSRVTRVFIPVVATLFLTAGCSANETTEDTGVGDTGPSEARQCCTQAFNEDFPCEEVDPEQTGVHAECTGNQGCKAISEDKATRTGCHCKLCYDERCYLEYCTPASPDGGHRSDADASGNG